MAKNKKGKTKKDGDDLMKDYIDVDYEAELRLRAEEAASQQGGTIDAWLRFLKSRISRAIALLLLSTAALSGQGTFVEIGGGLNLYGEEGVTNQGTLASVSLTRTANITDTYGYYVSARTFRRISAGCNTWPHSYP